jgi:DNA gyrase/topoisomerase IV subunit A
VRSIGRATQGVTIIDLEENDKVVSIARLVEKEEDDAAGSTVLEPPAEPTTEPPAE